MRSFPVRAGIFAQTSDTVTNIATVRATPPAQSVQTGSRSCYSPTMPWPTIALEEWKPVSRPVAIIAIAFYLLFLLYAALSRSNFLFLDYANLMIHEAGHPLFSPFGETLMILAFCSFWFFENFLYIGTYMSDARTLALPLVGSGDHDWEILFTQWNLLHHQQISHATRTFGWLGTLASLTWFTWISFRSKRSG